jgi:hypothetical protein
MKTTLYSAVALSVFLAAGTAAAQSNTGTPNTLHGSGDMMQDGPHATANPYASATDSSLPSGRAVGRYQSDKEVCEKKWREARLNGTAAGVSHMDYISACRSTL